MLFGRHNEALVDNAAWTSSIPVMCLNVINWMFECVQFFVVYVLCIKCKSLLDFDHWGPIMISPIWLVYS